MATETAHISGAAIAVFAARCKIITYVRVQLRLTAVPAPAAVAVECDVRIGVEVDHLARLMPLDVAAVVQVAVPEMEQPTGDMRHTPSHGIAEGLGPAQIVCPPGRVHAE